MGGGAILRNFARAAVASTPAAARNLASSSSSSGAGSSRCTMISAHSPPFMRLSAPSIVEDWEFAGDEFAIQDHLVFGSAPSRVEVEEATSELENVLGMCVGEVVPTSPLGNCTQLAAADSNETAVNAETVEMPPAPPSASVSQTSSIMDWIEPHLVSDASGKLQVRRRTDVMDAFRLLQNDPTVKGVVMSIASDKAVWDAVLSNDKVKELRRKLSEAKACETAEAGDKDAGLLSLIADYSKNLYHRFECALKEIFDSLLSFVDNKFRAEKKNTDTAVKSCFMLGIMVVSIVLLKRAVV